MKFLVLRQFMSFGKCFKKGSVVNGEEIRSPRLRQSEGKIVPAVSSFNVPVEFNEELAPQEDLGDDNKASEEVEQVEPPKLLLVKK